MILLAFCSPLFYNCVGCILNLFSNVNVTQLSADCRRVWVEDHSTNSWCEFTIYTGISTCNNLDSYQSQNNHLTDNESWMNINFDLQCTLYLNVIFIRMLSLNSIVYYCYKLYIIYTMRRVNSSEIYEFSPFIVYTLFLCVSSFCK